MSSIRHDPPAAAPSARAQLDPSQPARAAWGNRRAVVGALGAAGLSLLGTLGLTGAAEARKKGARINNRNRNTNSNRSNDRQGKRKETDSGATPPPGAVLWVDVQESQTWSDLGQSTQFGSERHVVDLTGFTQLKVMGVVSKAGQGELRVDWEIDPATNDFATLVGSIDLDSTGVKQTDYVAIPAQAQGLITIVAAAAGGSGNSPETRGVAIMALA